MILALAIAAILVQPGDTLSGIASSHGVSLAAVEQANPQLSNPNVIYAGQPVTLPAGQSATQSAPVQQSAPAPQNLLQAVSAPSAGSGGGSLSDVPGVPSSFAACVAFRESTNGTNAAYNGGVYGIITASGVNVNGQSVAAQKQAFSQLYAQYGSAPWTPSDGC